MLPGQFHRSIPERVWQLCPPRPRAAKFLQLALQLRNWFGNGLFSVHLQPPPRRLFEPNNASYLTSRMLAERTQLDSALSELPTEQRDVFIAHEIQGRSFKELAAESGVSVNALLSRRHYAAVYLPQTLRAVYEEMVQESGVQA